MEEISSYLARYNLPRSWAQLTAAGSWVQQQWHERSGKKIACRASDNPKQNELVPVSAQGSASHAEGSLYRQLPHCWRMAGERQHDKALLPDRSWLRDSSRCQSPASPWAQQCQGAGLTHRACGQERKARAVGCWQCKGRIANESPSVNTDALWRGLWQKCRSCYKEPFTASAESSQCDGAAQAGSTACRLRQGSGRATACKGKPWGEDTTSERKAPNIGNFPSCAPLETALPHPHLSGAQCYSSRPRLGERLLRALLHLSLCVTSLRCRRPFLSPRPSPHGLGAPHLWD